MFSNFDQVLTAVQSGFSRARILVVGDLMLDRHVWGEVRRISPEAPVPVVRVLRQTESPGGAANVAMNLAGLGLQVSVAGFTGADEARDRLIALLQSASVDASATFSVAQYATVQKTRIIGGHQQMLRLDVEEVNGITDADRDRLIAGILPHLAEQTDVVILSDYAKGVLGARVCRAIIDAATQRGIPVLVDPKGADYARYAGATMLSPNRAELAAATGQPAGDIDALLAAGRALCRALGLAFLVMTRSEEGITLIEPDQVQHAPATAREVFDVSGAGDTVIATLAAALGAGLPRMDAVQLANLAAGVVVGKVGTAPISQAELIDAITTQRQMQQSNKICDLDELLARVDQWHRRGERIVFTNGCFDLLHAGHVVYLENARREGQHLVVGLNTDASVRRLKGPQRPIIQQADRARVLAALASVDAVVLFDDDTPIDLIRTVHPDVLVKGNDYTEDQVVGGRDVKAWGGKVVLVPVVEGHSTTRIVQKMNQE